MRYANTDHRRASKISRLVFAAGLVLLVPGTGLTLRAHSPANDNPAVNSPARARRGRRPLRGNNGTVADLDLDGQSDLKVAEDVLQRAEYLFKKGYVSKGQLEREQAKVQQIKERTDETRRRRRGYKGHRDVDGSRPREGNRPSRGRGSGLREGRHRRAQSRVLPVQLPMRPAAIR